MLLSFSSWHGELACGQWVMSATCVLTEPFFFTAGTLLPPKGLWVGGLVKWLKRIQALSTKCFCAWEPGRELMRTSRRQPISRCAGATAKLTILGAKKRETRISSARGAGAGVGPGARVT